MDIDKLMNAPRVIMRIDHVDATENGIEICGVRLYNGDKVRVTYYEEDRDNYFDIVEEVVNRDGKWYFMFLAFDEVPMYRLISTEPFNGSVITKVVKF